MLGSVALSEASKDLQKGEKSEMSWFFVALACFPGSSMIKVVKRLGRLVTGLFARRDPGDVCAEVQIEDQVEMADRDDLVSVPSSSNDGRALGRMRRRSFHLCDSVGNSLA